LPSGFVTTKVAVTPAGQASVGESPPGSLVALFLTSHFEPFELSESGKVSVDPPTVTESVAPASMFEPFA